MHVVALSVQLDQLGLEVGADLGEDSSECFDSLAIKAAVAAFGDKDQMNVHCRSAMPAVSKVLDFVHGPDNNESIGRKQAFRFRLMPNGEQQRQMRRFAGCARYVYNKALALKKERYEKKEQLTRFQLDKLLVQWKQETPWLREAPAHALQQAILDLDRAYTNFFERRAKFPNFHKKGVRDSFRESNQKSSNNWEKAKAKVTQLYQRIANTRKHFLHKVSSDISKNHAVVMVEDLQVKNMSASAAGTREQPGRRVKAKSGLNRSILDAS